MACSLGFINPLLYQLADEKPHAFFDVTVGDNKCLENGLCCPNGYVATRGWDATTGITVFHLQKMFKHKLIEVKMKKIIYVYTGVGTPNYDVLKEMVTEMAEAELAAIADAAHQVRSQERKK